MSVVNVGSGSHNTDCNSKLCNNQRQHWQASPSNEEHWGISEISGPVIGKDSRKHNLRGSPYSRKSRKIRSPLGIEKKKLMIKHMLNIATEDLRFVVNGVLLAIRITCVSKNDYYLVQILASTGKYCLISLACPLFHIKETVVHTIRPHYTVTVLISVVILGRCHEGHC